MKCKNCGCEFDSKFCPDCGTPREESYIVETIDNDSAVEEQIPVVEENEETQSEGDIYEMKTFTNEKQTKQSSVGSKIASILFNIFRWIMVLYLVIGILVAMSEKAWATLFIWLICAILTAPPSKKIRKEVEEKYSISISGKMIALFAVVAFILGICLLSSSSSSTPNGMDSRTEQASDNQAMGLESAETVFAGVSDFDKETAKKINKIEKYISKGNYEKAKEMIQTSEFNERENTYILYKLESAQGNKENAAKILLDYSNSFENLSLLNDDALYNELVIIKADISDNKADVDNLVHRVKVATVGYEEGHDWEVATCTKSRTCSTCGETDGKPLGHDFSEATCTEPKTCSVCGETEGESLGHQVAKWKTIEKPSCSEEGKESGYCDVCEQDVEQAISKVEHTPGKEEIAVEATETLSGKKEVHCKVCGELISSENYYLSEAEKADYYAKSCEKVSYDDLIRYPDKYEGKRIQITVKISEIETVDSWIFDDQYEATASGKILSVVEGRANPEPKFMPGDSVTVYGEGNGYTTRYTYRKGVLIGLPHDIETEKIPCVKVIYAKIN